MLKIIFYVLLLIALVDNVQAQESGYELLGSYKTEGYVFAVSVSSNGSFIAASSPGKIYSFDREGKPLWNIYPKDGLKEMKVCSNGEYIALRSEGEVYLFNKNGNQLNFFSPGHDVHNLAISPDCSYVVAASITQIAEGGRYIFISKQAGPLRIGFNIPGSINTLSISSNGSYIAAGYSTDRIVYSTGLEEDEIGIFNRSEDFFYPFRSFQTDSEVRIVSISSDGSFLSAVSGNNIYFYDINLGKMSKKDMLGINAISVSSNGSYVAALSGDNIHLFNRSGTLLWSYNTNYSTTDVMVSSDSSRIIAASGRDIYIFDNGGTLLWSYRTDKDVLSVSLSPDGSYAAAGSKDLKVYFIGEKASQSITPAIQTTLATPEVPIITTSTQTPETFQNYTTPNKSTPFPSVLSAIVMLLVFWCWQRR
ncbi:MAG: hypothetical protein O8C66_07610 [Candidatus Methanoperedens sp.]|nr:hypothetical protein [Candidatus Methanoperedens sp.]MCZ7370361.1 hypothetical protein [Candidatus Methanoperedens sp.]